MNYYRDPDNGTVYAYDADQVSAGLVRDGLVEMSPGEIDRHLNPPPTAGELQSARLKANNAAYSAATVAITADYPQLEKDTWPTQDKESKAWLVDPDNALTPWIDRAALTRGIDRVEYLRRTLAKAQQFEMVSSYLTGTRQKYEDQIKAGGDPVLDYAIPPSLYAEMQAKALLTMTAPTVDLKEHL